MFWSRDVHRKLAYQKHVSLHRFACVCACASCVMQRFCHNKLKFYANILSPMPSICAAHKSCCRCGMPGAFEKQPRVLQFELVLGPLNEKRTRLCTKNTRDFTADRSDQNARKSLKTNSKIHQQHMRAHETHISLHIYV